MVHETASISIDNHGNDVLRFDATWRFLSRNLRDPRLIDYVKITRYMREESVVVVVQDARPRIQVHARDAGDAAAR